MTAYLPSLFGGMLLGLSAVLLLLVNGRIAGISGILGNLLGARNAAAGIAFVIGLLAGPFLYAAVLGDLPAMTVTASWPAVLLAGLLVGIGTRMGSGCTSGHGILGLARFSKRSLAATATFLVAGIISATTMGVFG
ncbi:YeeE/YedE family protein [Rhizobium viscosum]|uniref:Membrane protein YedE/YeeE n=1 Tax=Rhizobium viscosum TaxID=1673 RepID=A0ABR9IU55_RHIVS|nr:YeeE/YedE thiosulfate transporter family protein [Rhizobium viscosum]MBE1506721.1 putative membrane protein YedE/YeeE [Rhizobium viscosum]